MFEFVLLLFLPGWGGRGAWGGGGLGWGGLGVGGEGWLVITTQKKAPTDNRFVVDISTISIVYVYCNICPFPGQTFLC